jgi:(2Fe-2S) ferredoxin
MTNPKRIWVCVTGRYCSERNPDKVLDALQEAVKKQGASDRIEVIGGGCLGLCGKGPNAIVLNRRDRTCYSGLTPSNAAEIITAHKDKDKPVKRLRSKYR